MTRRLFLSWLLLLCCLPSASFAEDVTEKLRLTLPPVGYAVVGSEISVYFDNIVLSKNSDELRFVVNSDLGTTEKNDWTVKPTVEQVGTHQWQIEVFHRDQSLAKGEMTWHISPSKVQDPKEITLLIIGDSLTHASIYSNSLASRLNASGLEGKWAMLGSHRPSSAAEGVAHEGYGGWTWQSFVKRYDPNPESKAFKPTSPFVFAEDGQPKLDVARYFRETCNGRIPDYIIFKLGINDCFSADSSSQEKIDGKIDEVFGHAETLLNAFREAAPDARFGICLTTPGNLREEAFKANYQDRYTRWGWKRIQHRLVERQLERFCGADSRRDYIDVIPTELNLDIVDGYPVNNAVHPNSVGYQQIGATIHAWLMSHLTAQK